MKAKRYLRISLNRISLIALRMLCRIEYVPTTIVK